MAADGDRKGPKGSKEPLAEILGDADGEWADAIEAWDSALDLPADAPSPAPVAASADSEGQVDPLVHFIEGGEMEIPDGGEQALGSLLGSTDGPRPAAWDLAAPQGDLPSDEIGLTPDEVTSADVEVEVQPEGWDATPVPAEIEEELTPVAPASLAEALASVEAAPAPEEITEEEPPTEPEELDLDGLMQGLDSLGQPAAPSTTAVAHGAAGAAEEEEEPAPEEPLPLEFLDDIVPLQEPEAFDEIQAGDVLPKVREPEPEHVGLIPQDLDQLELEEPELAPPPIPPELGSIDLDSLELPERVEPIAPLAPYLERLTTLLSFELGLTDSSARAAAMELMAARAFEESGATDEAIEHYRDLLNHQPGHLPAMRALRRIYAERGEVDQVAELLGQMGSRVGDRERVALLATRAELLWSRTGDDDGARALVDEMPAGELRQLLIRADLAAAAGDADELADLLARLTEKLGDGPTHAALRVEQGRALEALGRPKDARTCYRKAGQSRAVLEGLLRVCGQLNDAEGMVGALVASAAEPGLWSARRLRRAARLAMHRKLDVPVRAHLERATQMASEDPLVLSEMAELLRTVEGGAQEAVDAFTRLASVEPEASQRALALLDAAVVAEWGLGDATRALEFYARAADVLTDSLLVQALMAQVKLVAQDPEARLEAHRALAGSSRGSQRSAHHLAAAQILRHELNRDEDAVGEFLEALEQDPANRVALWALEGLFRQADKLDKLAAMLDTEAEAADNLLDATELRRRAAMLYEGPLGDPEAAASRYREALERDPSSVSARLGLDRVLATQKRWAELAESTAHQAMNSTDSLRAAGMWAAHGDLLVVDDRQDEATDSYRMALDKSPGFLPASLALTLVHARAGRWGEVAELWSSSIDGLPADAAMRRGLQMRLGALQELELDDAPAAVLTYEAALEQPNPAPGALEGLLRALRRAHQTDRLTAELDRELTRTTDPAMRFAVLVTAAELSRKSGIDWSEVETRLKRALEQVPDHPVATRALEQLYQSQTAWQPLADLHLAGLKQEEIDPPGRVALYEKLAWLDRERGDADSACLSYESIVDLDPGHLGALRFLQSSYLGTERHDKLARILRLQAEQTSTSDATPIWITLGLVLAAHPAGEENEEDEHLPQGEQSDAQSLSEEAAYLAAVERDPLCVFALRRLVDAARLGGRTADLARHYTDLAAAVSNEQEMAVYLARAGELTGEIDLYRQAMAKVPDYLGAIYRLRDSALRAADWEAAYEAADAECRVSANIEHRTNAGLLAGEIAQSKLQDQERAAAAFKNALADSPGNRVAFQQLRQFLEEHERWSDLAELLSSRARVERSRPRLMDLYRSLAAIHRDRLDDRDQAKQQLKILLKLDEEDRETLADLALLYEADEQWAEAANSLIRLARLERDTAQLAELFLRLGRIYQDGAPDSRRAIVSLRKVLALDPENLEALERLSQLYISELDFQKALSISNQLLEQETDRQRRVEILLRVAKIHEDGLKDPHQAAIAYRQALEIAPTDLDAIGKVIGFFVRQADQRSLMIHLDRSVATMRGLLRHNPVDSFAFRALFKIFGWRKAPDGCFCAAQVLDALGQAGSEERAFLDSHVAAVGSPGKALGDTEFDEQLFDRSIPGGFRQVFRLLSDPFTRYYGGDIKQHGATRADRIADVDHPARRIGDALVRDFDLTGGYEIYLLKSKPTALIVENTSPPSILVGKALLHEATETEIQFLMARSLWIISRSMILPAFLRREELELLMAGIVRQYQPDFQPAEVEFKALQEATKKVGKAIPRKLKQELMPFALECSGAAVDLKALGAAVIYSANRTGLLTCRSIFGALSMLCRMSGLMGLPADAEGRMSALVDNPEAAELLRFMVSDAHSELRRGMHIAVH